jgi:hypothetical protein
MNEGIFISQLEAESYVEAASAWVDFVTNKNTNIFCGAIRRDIEAEHKYHWRYGDKPIKLAMSKSIWVIGYLVFGKLCSLNFVATDDILDNISNLYTIILYCHGGTYSFQCKSNSHQEALNEFVQYVALPNSEYREILPERDEMVLKLSDCVLIETSGLISVWCGCFNAKDHIGKIAIIRTEIDNDDSELQQ